MRSHSETSVFKFLRRGEDRALFSMQPSIVLSEGKFGVFMVSLKVRALLCCSVFFFFFSFSFKPAEGSCFLKHWYHC